MYLFFVRGLEIHGDNSVGFVGWVLFGNKSNALARWGVTMIPNPHTLDASFAIRHISESEFLNQDPLIDMLSLNDKTFNVMDVGKGCSTNDFWKCDTTLFAFRSAPTDQLGLYGKSYTNSCNK